MSSKASDRIQSSGFFEPGFLSKLAAALCLALLGLYGVIWGSTVQDRGGADRYVRQTEFLIQLTGAHILAGPHPELLYDIGEQRDIQERLLPSDQHMTELLPFNHPPFSALALEPLVKNDMPLQTIFTIWTLVSAAAAGISLGVLAAAWPPRGSASWLLMLASTSFFPLIVALMQGQPTPLVLLGWAGCSAALKLRRDWLAGSVLALAIFKPQTLPLILLALLLMRRWKALGGFAATVGLASVAVMPFVGADWPLRYVDFLLYSIGMPVGGSNIPAIMQNLRGLFSGLFGVQVGAYLALAAAALAALFVALLWLRRDRKSEAGNWQPDSPAWDLRWALTLFLAMLTSLHTYGHDLTPAIVPGWIIACLIANGNFAPSRQVRWAGWLWLGYLAGLTGGLPDLLPVHYLAVIWMLITALALALELRGVRDSAPAREPALELA